MQTVPVDMTEVNVTPVFKYLDVENVPQSEQAGHEVRQSLVVVEIHTAGSRNALPVFRATDVWKREGNRSITYAERFAPQYEAFLAGNSQKASGTPLEMLRPFGIAPELQSVCRANKIYSVEALCALSQDAVRNLGVHANKLREAAQAYMAKQTSAVDQAVEIETLKAQLAELQARVPADDEPPVATEEGDLTDAELKEAIREITGHLPRGNPSRETLLRTLSEVQDAGAQQAA